MKMRTLRKLRTHAPRRARRTPLVSADVSVEPEPAPPPEAVFDRVTGPFGSRRSTTLFGLDEET